MSGTGKPEKARHWHYLAAIGVCGGAVLLTLPLHGQIDLANIILLFVLAVAVIAAVWGRGPAMLASFVAVACFNFFFVPPRFSFSVSNAEYLITFVVMLLVSLLISYLSNAYRLKAEEAERRAGESALLHEFAQALSGALTYAHVAALLGEFMQRRFATDATLFVPNADEHLGAISDSDAHHHVSMVELVAAQGVYASGAPTGPVAELHDSARTILLPLLGATRRRGVLAFICAMTVV